MWQVHFFLPVVCFLAQSSVDDQTRLKSLQPFSIHLPPVDTQGRLFQVVPLHATEGTSDDESTSSFKFTSPIPEYNELAKAVDVFDDVYFYKTDSRRIDYREDREEVLGSMTVKEAYLKFTEGRNDIERGLVSFANAIGALEARVLRYFDSVEMKAEDVLNKMKIIALTSPRDVEIFKDRMVASLRVSKELLMAVESKNEKRRALNLAMVLGSSGSGKTFFALQELATRFQKSEQKHVKTVTLHVCPSETGVQFLKNNQENPEAAKDLCNWIKRQVSDIIKRQVKEKLQMHVCIILDEAGDLSVRSWFENRDMLQRLCLEVESIAESVFVVVSGTALTGKGLNSKDDAYVFRMKPWSAKDLGMILGQDNTLLSLIEGKETVDSVANAIFAHPKIGALATNGRSAYFLCKAITRLSRQYKSIVWKSQLNAWATALVTRVVEDYVAANGLNDLEPSNRRRVAASVFHALKNTKELELTLPTFAALNDNEIAMAYSLVQTNIESGKDKLQLVGKEKFAITITPAIAVVLYAIAGIPTTLMPGWKAEEELAGLYAVRQLMLASMGKYENEISRDEKRLKAIKKSIEQVRSNAQDKLDQSLASIQLLALQTKIKPEPDQSGKILVPMVGSSTVLINGEITPFADVIAPYMLIQAKRKTTNSTRNKPVDMVEELEKCSLLKRCDDDRLLRGLVELWRGKLDTKNYKSEPTNPQRQSGRIRQRSAAFPENILCLETPDDPCAFAVLEGNNITAGDTTRPLPPLGRRTVITFVLSTNVDSIKLRLSPRKIVTITERNLDKDLTIDSDKFSHDVERTAWANFVRDEVREGVVIKILLTKSI